MIAVPPTSRNGKICYIEFPAADVKRSAEFYEKVFGWNVRRRSNGQLAFDDTVGEVSGTWVTGRPASAAPGLLFYIMVDSVEATVERSSRSVTVATRSSPAARSVAASNSESDS